MQSFQTIHLSFSLLLLITCELEHNKCTLIKTFKDHLKACHSREWTFLAVWSGHHQAGLIFTDMPPTWYKVSLHISHFLSAPGSLPMLQNSQKGYEKHLHSEEQEKNDFIHHQCQLSGLIFKGGESGSRFIYTGSTPQWEGNQAELHRARQYEIETSQGGLTCVSNRDLIKAGPGVRFSLIVGTRYSLPFMEIRPGWLK